MGPNATPQLPDERERPEDASSSSPRAPESSVPSVLRPAIRVGTSRIAIGQLIDRRFEVLEHIGSGGMGDVFRVADTYRNRAQRALKTIRPDLARNPDFVSRFQIEVGIALSITHPNVCRVYDLGIDTSADSPLLYYTMEFLEGDTLAGYLADRGSVPLGQAEALALGIVAGLEAAHARGIVHRDLKPGNIMMAAGSNDLRPVILDFGLAVSADHSPGESNRDGTFHYMAPEQFSGGAMTPATDVFALGLILYESISGQRPKGITTLTQYLQSVAAESKGRTIDRNQIPARWARIILRCIRTIPSERFPEVSAVRHAIEEWHRLPRRLVLGGVVLVSASTVWAVWPRPPKGSVSKIAAADAAYQKGKLHARRLTADELGKAVTFFQEAIRLDPDFAAAWSGLADAYTSLGDYGGMPGREAFVKAQQAARAATEKGPRMAETHASLGLALSLDPRHWRESEPSFLRAIEVNSQYGPAHQWYGAHLARLGRTREAIDETRRALAGDPVSLPISAVVGWMYYYDRQHDEAIRQAQQTIDLDPGFLYGYLILARAYAELNRFDDSLAACRRAASIGGQNAPDPPVVLSARACTLAKRGDRDAAIRIAAELEEAAARQSVPAHYIASAYSLTGDFDQAFDRLTSGVDRDDSGVLYLRAYPPFDPIRKDRRYTALLERLHFPQAATLKAVADDSVLTP